MDLNLASLEYIELQAIDRALANIVPLSNGAYDLKKRVHTRLIQVEAERLRRLGKCNCPSELRESEHWAYPGWHHQIGCPFRPTGSWIPGS